MQFSNHRHLVLSHVLGSCSANSHLHLPVVFVECLKSCLVLLRFELAFHFLFTFCHMYAFVCMLLLLVMYAFASFFFLIHNSLYFHSLVIFGLFLSTYCTLTMALFHLPLCFFSSITAHSSIVISTVNFCEDNCWNSVQLLGDQCPAFNLHHSLLWWCRWRALVIYFFSGDSFASSFVPLLSYRKIFVLRKT